MLITTMSQVTMLTGDNPPKMGASGPNQGAAAPQANPISPILQGMLLTNIPKVVSEVWFRYNISRCQFGGFTRGSWIFQGINPLLSTYKRRYPLLTNNKTHKDKSYLT